MERPLIAAHHFASAIKRRSPLFCLCNQAPKPFAWTKKGG
jgi:hypothetical protein